MLTSTFTVSGARSGRAAALLAVSLVGLAVVAPPPAYAAAGVDPPAVELTLAPGASSSFSTNVTTPAVAPRPDIVLLADTTGSMDPVLANVRNNTSRIIGEVRASQPTARFAVTEYKEQADGPRVFAVNTPLTPDADAVVDGTQQWLYNVGGGGAPWTDFLNAHYRIATDAIAFRPNSTRIIAWFGDARSHDPSLGHTLADTNAALRQTGARVLAIPVSDTPTGGLDALGQASSITAATRGVLIPPQPANAVAQAILDAIHALEVAVTPQPFCDAGLTMTFDLANRTVRSGTAAAFTGTVTVSPDATAGTRRCTVDHRVAGVSVGFTQTVTVHVTGDAPTLAIGDVTVAEGNSGTTSATFTVSLSGTASGPVTVQAATADGTATSPADFTGGSATVTFAPGQVSTSFTVPVVGDQLDEPDETFTVNLSNAVNATIGDGAGVGTITDDDDPPVLRSLRVGDVTVAEGNSGTTSATFTVSLDGAASGPVTVRAATADGTATSPADFTATSAVLTFAPGELSRQLTVPVAGDQLDESDETFTVGLTDATNAIVGDAGGVGTIVDDDDPPVVPAVSVGDVTVAEGATSATFTVALDQPTTNPVSVRYATANGTAAAPGDYTATTGTLELAPGQTSRQVTVPVVGDVIDEPTETFTLNLSAPVGVRIVDGTGVGTITDDDRDGAFTCRASAVNLLGSQPWVANPPGAPCKDASTSVPVANVGTLLLNVRANGVVVGTDQTPDNVAVTAPAADDGAGATTTVSTTRISTVGLTVEVGAITSRASARCVQGAGGLTPSLAGSSTIGSLTINGAPVRIGSAPVTIPLLVGSLKLNSTTTTATSVTQRAVELSTLLGTVVLGESRAGLSGSPCTS